jgi:hypothetical protein
MKSIFLIVNSKRHSLLEFPCSSHRFYNICSGYIQYFVVSAGRLFTKV